MQQRQASRLLLTSRSPLYVKGWMNKWRPGVLRQWKRDEGLPKIGILVIDFVKITVPLAFEAPRV